MSMAGVFAKANVGEDEQIELRFADRFDRELYGSLWGRRLGASFVFLFGQAEQNHGGDSQIRYLVALFDDLVGRLLIYARHRGDFAADARPGAGKHGVDQAAGGEMGLAYKPAHRFGTAQAPRTMNWEGHVCLAVDTWR